MIRTCSNCRREFDTDKLGQSGDIVLAGMTDPRKPIPEEDEVIEKLKAELKGAVACGQECAEHLSMMAVAKVTGRSPNTIQVHTSGREEAMEIVDAVELIMNTEPMMVKSIFTIGDMLTKDLRDEMVKHFRAIADAMDK